MGIKDYLIISLGTLGQGWGIVQFLLNRKYQKEDKIIEKRFEIYLNFINQIDEISVNMRKDPNIIYGFSTECMSEILAGDEERINKSLLKLNERLLETTRESLQPIMIINSELNKLKLVASEKLLPKISEYKVLINDYTNELQLILNDLSTKNDLEYNVKQLGSIGYEERGKRIKSLLLEIETLMRNEIGYYKK